jgi:hypothetical protein
MLVFVKAIPEAGFNRAGRRWPSGGTEADVDAATVAILEAEPMLVVERREPEAVAPVSKPVAAPEPVAEVAPEPVPVTTFDKPRHKRR